MHFRGRRDSQLIGCLRIVGHFPGKPPEISQFHDHNGCLGSFSALSWLDKAELAKLTADVPGARKLAGLEL